MANKSQSKSQQTYSAAYKSSSRWASNRKRKLERQLKLQPGNEAQIKTAIGNISYRRCTPKTPQWSSGNRRVAQLFKYFGGYAHPDLFSSNDKTRSAALQYSKPNRDYHNLPQGKVSFSLAARAHDKQGALVWS